MEHLVFSFVEDTVAELFNGLSGYHRRSHTDAERQTLQNISLMRSLRALCARTS